MALQPWIRLYIVLSVLGGSHPLRRRWNGTIQSCLILVGRIIHWFLSSHYRFDLPFINIQLFTFLYVSFFGGHFHILCCLHTKLVNLVQFLNNLLLVSRGLRNVHTSFVSGQLVSLKTVIVVKRKVSSSTAQNSYIDTADLPIWESFSSEAIRLRNARQRSFFWRKATSRFAAFVFSFFSITF